jgi:competence protein ComEA
MFGSRRLRRSEVARARLRALTPSWVPTPELVAQAFATTPPPTPGPVDLAEPATAPAPLPSLAPEVGRPDIPRLGLDRSAARGLVTLALGGVVGAAAVLALGWPRGDAAPETVSPPIITGGSAAPTGLSSSAAPTTTQTSAVVVVDVAGKVRKPGVVELAVGSRVIDAIRAAGGVTAHGETTGLNLAQVLVDGEQVLVSGEARQPAVVGGGAATAPTGSAPALVNINTATIEELDVLPGIGPVLAQAIIDWRVQNSRFTSIDQLQEVSGIGDATYADLAPLVRV